MLRDVAEQFDALVVEVTAGGRPEMVRIVNDQVLAMWWPSGPSAGHRNERGRSNTAKCSAAKDGISVYPN